MKETKRVVSEISLIFRKIDECNDNLVVYYRTVTALIKDLDVNIKNL